MKPQVTYHGALDMQVCVPAETPIDEIKNHVWPDLNAVIVIDNLSDVARLPTWAYDMPIAVSAHSPGDKAAEALLSAGTQLPAVEFPDVDLESIDRTRVNVWLKRCRDSAPKDLHTSVARELVAGLLANIQDDIEAVNALIAKVTYTSCSMHKDQTMNTSDQRPATSDQRKAGIRREKTQ